MSAVSQARQRGLCPFAILRDLTLFCRGWLVYDDGWPAGGAALEAEAGGGCEMPLRFRNLATYRKKIEMTVTIELPPDIEAGLLAQAQSEGLAVSEYVQNLVREQIETRSANVTMLGRPAYDLPPEEWVRQFHEWTQGHAKLDLPILSDDDISRESIFAERGL